MSEHLTATYEIRPGRGESAEERAQDIALEQTVELPAALVPAAAAGMVGEVRSVEPSGRGVWQARIRFPVAATAAEWPQLINLLFGNISLKRGLRLIDVNWPQTLLDTFGGPGTGTEGLRALTGVPRRALLATALKPMGLSASELAARCSAFARGGVDIIKDDHGLTDQAAAPFEERLARCQAAVTDANAATGRRCQYFPNVTAQRTTLMARARAAREAGCAGVLVNPWLTGMDAVAWLRDEPGLAVMAHPALTGDLFSPRHGISAPLLLGELFRIAGGDAVIYPNRGGRFGFSLARCERINERLRRPLGGLRAAMPTPGGGLDVTRIGAWARHYGRDTLFLVGGSLYARGDIAAASARLIEALEHAHDE
ncbi:RuBisCO large subunit C-terminal-like domain-containing protein [Arhodomonas aquaeolei]|uniref:RuBisCO large subunit C-terminal-like domain-containing protein n=1 Tax=Arhodomonas aquaeolei TaxID=2369 RepID=UPI000362E40B|nr:RuBisCO large subunit C-terminal-like domain-containing protein [Arhodomonas aquaeolei]